MIDFFSILRQLVVSIFLLAGIYFLLSAAVGLLRFPDFYTRLHAGSKCVMAGSILVLLGCIVLEGIGFVSLKLIVILVFLFITNPIAIHAIATLYDRITHKKITSKNTDERLE